MIVMCQCNRVVNLHESKFLCAECHSNNVSMNAKYKYNLILEEQHGVGYHCVCGDSAPICEHCFSEVKV
jgi:hypothetical protein